MPAPLEFYFDFSSPYSYLAAHGIEDLAAELGREVIWRPILLGAIFKVTGGRPLADIPLKGSYMGIDVPRSARFFGLPFAWPDPFPFPAVAASRAVYWAEETLTPAKAKALALALFDRAFGEGGDIVAAESVADVAAGVGLDAEALTAALQDQRIKDRLRAEVDGAIARDIFGAPMVLVDGEPFWGRDRFDQIRRRLGRARVTPPPG